jgi:HEAT repeat protein
MLNLKLLLRILPAVLLSGVQIFGFSEAVRSQVIEAEWSGAIAQSPPSETEKIDRLIQQLKSDDPIVRSSEIYALGSMGKSAKAGIPNLIPLLNDSNRAVRKTVVYAVGNMDEAAKASIPSLIPLLNDNDSEVRSLAAEALKKTWLSTLNFLQQNHADFKVIAEGFVCCAAELRAGVGMIDEGRSPHD